MKFIMTQDEETANKLNSLGFTLVQKQGNIWTFLNDEKLHYSKDENMVLTNQLTM